MPENLDEILQKKMTRTEFLGLIGAGALSVVGITSLLKNLSEGTKKQSGKTAMVDGYGASTYGGSSKPTR